MLERFHAAVEQTDGVQVIVQYCINYKILQHKSFKLILFLKEKLLSEQHKHNTNRINYIKWSRTDVQAKILDNLFRKLLFDFKYNRYSIEKHNENWLLTHPETKTSICPCTCKYIRLMKYHKCFKSITQSTFSASV